MEVYKGKLPLDRFEGIDGALKSGGHVSQPKRHSLVAICAVMKSERRLVEVGFGDGYLPIPLVTVEARKYSKVTKRVETFVHCRDRVTIRYRLRVLTTIVDAER